MQKTTDNNPLSDHALDQLFREARTYNDFSDQDVPDTMIQAVYDLAKWGATSANCQPARFVFVKSPEAKAKLKPHLMEGNIDKTMSAPVTVLIAHDMEFYENLPEQFPHADAKSWFAGQPEVIQDGATRNGTLQGAYLMIAARALGLDCGAMSGFDKEGVYKDFFAPEHHNGKLGQKFQVDFICNLGYGTTKNLFDRSPRLSFNQACMIV